MASPGDLGPRPPSRCSCWIVMNLGLGAFGARLMGMVDDHRNRRRRLRLDEFGGQNLGRHLHRRRRGCCHHCLRLWWRGHHRRRHGYRLGRRRPRVLMLVEERDRARGIRRVRLPVATARRRERRDGPRGAAAVDRVEKRRLWILSRDGD